jgi:hypothetical protein
MDHRDVAAVGMIAIGAVASAAVYWIAWRRVGTGPERRAVRAGAASFALAVCTFLGVLPVLDARYAWVLALPLAAVWLALDTLHRLGTRAGQRAKPGAAADPAS